MKFYKLLALGCLLGGLSVSTSCTKPDTSTPTNPTPQQQYSDGADYAEWTGPGWYYGKRFNSESRYRAWIYRNQGYYDRGYYPRGYYPRGYYYYYGYPRRRYYYRGRGHYYYRHHGRHGHHRGRGGRRR